MIGRSTCIGNLLALLTVASVGLAQAATALEAGLLPLAPGAQSSRPDIALLVSDDASVHLTFELSAVEVETFDLPGERFQTLHFARSELMGAVGEPALPAFSRFLQIPAQSGARARVLATEAELLSDVRLLPMQDVDGSAFAFDEAVYGRDVWLGGEPVEIGDPIIMRGLRVVPITFHPVRYNPARGEAEILTRIEVVVDYSGFDPRNVMTERVIPLTRDFDELYRARVLNYEYDGGRSDDETATSLGTWVLIYRDSNDVLTRLQPLIDWRRRMGFNVRVASTAETGTTNTAIRNWLTSAYNTWPDPPEYVALAGDATGSYSLPTFNENVTGYHGEGDHPYSQLSGSDNVPEVFVGRLSFESLTELETIVAKILDYEKTPNTSDPNWFHSACLVGDPSGSGYTCIQIQQWLKERLRSEFNYTRIDTIFSGPFSSRMAASVNAGVSYFGYRGYWGMSGWGIGNIYALTNQRKLPFALNLTCGTGSFASDLSINEAWLRAGSPTNLIGGIGSIATATLGTHTRFNNCYYHGVAYGFFWENFFRLGVAQACGKLEMILNYNQWDPTAVTAWCYWNTLMGDPATELWTGTPKQLWVSHPATVALGANVVTVDVQQALSGVPVEGAWVYLRGAGDIGIGGLTDASGSAEIPINASATGNVLVTVTGHNLRPYQGSFTIQQLEHFVGVAYATLDDGSSPPADGNGDGQMNPGEAVSPSIYLSNHGTSIAENVSLTIECSDRYVDLLEAGPVNYGSINPGGIAAPLGAIAFRVAEGAPDAHEVHLDLSIRARTYAWHAILDLPVVAPELNYTSHTLAGCGTLLDPGESATLTVTLSNDGAASGAGPIHAQFISDSYSVDVTDGIGTYAGSIPPGGVATNSSDAFGLSSPADCVPGQLASLRLALTFADGVRDTVPFTIVVGTADTQDPTGPDAYGYFAFDNTDDAYAEKPTYSWIDIVGTGTFLGLTDYGENQDDVMTVDLPFPFQYYGETFTRVSICSNGWIAMGATYLTDYRNWYMPAAGGPANQIAPFWDNLYQTTSGKVYHWFDEANHRYVIAWDNVRMLTDYSNYLESCEVILYDPAYYPTYSGDGVIVFQYETVNNNDSEQHYCTVGIQNREHTEGLTYSYYYTEAATAATLQAGRAIKFTTAGPGASSAHSDGMQQPGLRLVMDSWPNPVREGTTIRFALDRARPVSLQIFDVDGRLVQTLVQGQLTAGEHRLEWPGTDGAGNLLPAGVYFYKLDSTEQSATRKLLILR
jgi:hypothetical protein